MSYEKTTKSTDSAPEGLYVKGDGSSGVVGRVWHMKRRMRRGDDLNPAINRARNLDQADMRRDGRILIGGAVAALAVVGLSISTWKHEVDETNAKAKEDMELAEQRAARCRKLFSNMPEEYRDTFRAQCKDNALNVRGDKVGRNATVTPYKLPDMPQSAEQTWCHEIDIQPNASPWSVAQESRNNYGLSGADTQDLVDNIKATLGLVDESGEFVRFMQPYDKLGECVSLEIAN